MLLRIIIFSIAALLAFCLLLAAARFIAQRRVAEKILIPGAAGIHQIEKVRLGGTDQWIQLRGWDRRKPLLLFLHGGPGFPQMPFSHLNSELEKDFVVVQWDQRAAGKSYASAVPGDSMRVAQFVADAHELLGLLLPRFGQRRCYVVAHSWGSLVGARLVAEHPELVTAYIGIGQAADLRATGQTLYDFALDSARSDGNTKAVAELQSIGRPPHSMEQHKPMDRWVNYYADREHPSPSRWWMAGLALESPAYSWADLVRIPLGVRYSFQQLWEEIFYRVNLSQEVPRLEVPVYFFLGCYDRVVSATVAQRYFEALEATQGKQIIWFENSGHWPHFEEAARYRAAVRRVRDETQKRNDEQ